MRKNLIFFVASVFTMLGTSPLHAADNLTVYNGTSSTKLSLNFIKGLTFAGEQLMVYTTEKEAPAVFNLADVKGLVFGTTATSIGQLAGTKGQFNIAYRQGILSAQGISCAKTALYTVSGQRIMSISAWDGSAINTEGMANGVYVLKVNNQTFKFVKQ